MSYKWFKANILTLNASKIKYILFKKKKDVNITSLKLIYHIDGYLDLSSEIINSQDGYLNPFSRILNPQEGFMNLSSGIIDHKDGYLDLSSGTINPGWMFESLQ